MNFARAMSRAGCSGSAEGRSAPLPTLTYEMQILDLTNLKPTPGARAAKAARPARGGGVPVATVAPASVVSQSAKQGTPIVKSGRLTRTGRPSPKPKRSRRYTARQLVDLAVAKKFLCRATDAACEFQRRRVLVSVFEAVRVLGLPVIAFARIAGVSPPTLYNWATKARDHGVEAIHPWAGRAYSEEEMELLSL